MSPNDFLNDATPLDIDEMARENIDDLKQHIQEGRELDPLVIYGDKSSVRNSDGRHRAIAARELGMTEVPVIDLRKPAKPVNTLAMDEASRMARAKDMGFDVDQTLYHGSTRDLDEIRKQPRKKQANPHAFNELGEAFLTDDPRIANNYATENTWERNVTGAVYPVHHGIKNPKIINYDDIAGMDEKGIKAIKKAALKEGHDGFKIGRYGGEEGYDYVPFKPEQIRSKFAKFDPAKRNSAKLLAGAAPFAAAGLANSLYRPESDKKL
jgi:hypothetical protein